MATEEEAAKAIAEADGAEFDGRVISVRLSEDKPKTEGTGKTFQRRAI
jgi:RNA recognition motif-containing protein